MEQHTLQNDTKYAPSPGIQSHMRGHRRSSCDHRDICRGSAEQRRRGGLDYGHSQDQCDAVTQKYGHQVVRGPIYVQSHVSGPESPLARRRCGARIRAVMCSASTPSHVPITSPWEDACIHAYTKCDAQCSRGGGGGGGGGFRAWRSGLGPAMAGDGACKSLDRRASMLRPLAMIR